MWYAENRLVCFIMIDISIVSVKIQQGPERLKGAYAYQTQLQ